MKQPVLYGQGGGGGSWVQTIVVTATSGATVTVSGGGETLTTVATGTAYAFSVHNQNTTYTISASIDGVSKSATSVTTGTSSGVISFASIDCGQIDIVYDNNFRGLTITCTDGVTNITKTAPSGGNSMSFYPPNTGSWTISGEVSGTTYYTRPNPVVVADLDVTVSTALQVRPNGQTVTPTDNIQTWLECGGIFDKTSYTTLADVLADQDTLKELMSDSNAADYLVRSTTWTSGICTNNRAMYYIGKYNYTSDTLLSDSTWGTAIVNSDYREKVLNVSVPTMTSNTAPSGELYSTYTNVWPNTDYYYLFNGITGTKDVYGGGISTTDSWVAYEFPTAKCIKGFFLMNENATPVYAGDFKIEASNDRFQNEVVELGSFTNSGAGTPSARTYYYFNNTNSYTSYRFHNTTWGGGASSNGWSAEELNFYGRDDVDETAIDIYSAVNDTVYYMDNGNSVTLCVTDSKGHATVSRTNLPDGTYTLYSTVAKDPTTLSNPTPDPFSKTVVVTSDTNDIYMMPDFALMFYWYGYTDEPTYDSCSGNDWTITHNTNYLYFTMGTAGGYNFLISNRITNVTDYNNLNGIYTTPAQNGEFQIGIQDPYVGNNNSNIIVGLTPPYAATPKYVTGVLPKDSKSGTVRVGTYYTPNFTSNLYAVWID